MNIKNFYCLIFGLCFLFTPSVWSSEIEELSATLANLLQKSKNKDITPDILNLNLTHKVFDQTSQSSVSFQEQINFTEAYKIIHPEKSEYAVNLKELYENTLRYNGHIRFNPSLLEKAQNILDFIFNENKENMNFVRTMEIAMLGGYFLGHVDKCEENIFPFVIASQKLFSDLRFQDRIDFLESFGTIGRGEQSITVHKQYDAPLEDRNGRYTYQDRVIGYLEKLKNSGEYNQNLILLTGLYFLKLYFTGAPKLPEDGLGGFQGEGKFIETNDQAHFKLSETKESEEIKKEAEGWSGQFSSNFVKRQKKLEVEQDQEKTKIPWYFYAGGLGIAGFISYLVYKHWDYFKNLRGK